MGGKHPHLGHHLVSGTYLLEGPSPKPQLVGDHAGVPRVALGLAWVGVAGPVHGNAGDVEDLLPALDQDRFEESRWPAHEVDAHGALPAQSRNLRAGSLQVLLRGLNPAGEHLLALPVEDANPVKGLAHVEAHPVHPLRLLLRPPLAVAFRVPPLSEPYGAILSHIPISGLGGSRTNRVAMHQEPSRAVLCEPCPVRRATTELYSRSMPKG